MSNKEQIELSHHIVRSLIDDNYDIEDGYIENEDLGFKYIEQEVTYTNLEKSYETSCVIVQRNLDNKFFKFRYDESSYHSFIEMNNGKSIRAYEVYPKEITITIYE